MECYFPVYLNSRNMFVPCGKCEKCLEKRQREWAYRLKCELGYYKESCFITLTYDPESMGHLETKQGFYSLDFRDMQLFLKRLRKRHPDRKIKYYSAGEYGDDGSRPHFHLILFGIGIDSFIRTSQGMSKVENGFNFYDNSIWKYGLVHVGTVELGSIHYLTDYITLFADKKKYIDAGLQPPTTRQSQGLGKEFAFKDERIFQRGYVTMYGKRIGIPRYFRKKNSKLDKYVKAPVIKPLSYLYYMNEYQKLLYGNLNLHGKEFEQIEYYKKLLTIKYSEQAQANLTKKMKKNLKKL